MTSPTDANSEAGSAYTSRAHDFTQDFSGFVQSLVVCVVF